jgi:NCAIR mutase (PurE)-related protein
MNAAIASVLDEFRSGGITAEEAEARIAALYSGDLGFAELDLRRQERTAYPEVVYCAGKTTEQALSIIGKMREHGIPVFATRASSEIAASAAAAFPDADYHAISRTLSIGSLFSEAEREGLVVVAAAGTSDLPAAWEAARTAEFFGSNAREDGIKIGEEKARKEKIESARKMKADGFTAEQIQKYAGLSPEEIRRL